MINSEKTQRKTIGIKLLDLCCTVRCDTQLRA